MTILKLRRVAIDTYKENVAYLHRNCSLYHSEGFQALSKIEIYCEDAKSPVIAVLNIVDDESITAVDELGLSEQTFEQTCASEGASVSINHAAPPSSIKFVHKKVAGYRLHEKDLMSICEDIVANRYSKIEIAAFLVGCVESGLDRDEVLHLTKAMIETGQRFDWGEKLIADKHCIGGIPGNRTTMIVVPIVAAHGMLIPKTSSRAITSPAGTADTMEVLAEVDLSTKELEFVLRQESGFLTWGGAANIAPVDDILISVERPLSLDSPGQMVASILSKKLAVGSTHLLIDIPIGSTAKIRSQSHALKLRKLFEYVGDHLGLNLEVVITDGRQPIGNGIGPVLEVRDVMRVLQNDPHAPKDLREKSLMLAGRILEFDPDVRGGHGYKLASDILNSGRALEKMQSIIAAQGPKDTPRQAGELKYCVLAQQAGVVSKIDNFQIAQIARLAGAPIDKAAGVDIYKKIGDKVKVGEELYAIHAVFRPDFNFSKAAAEKNNAYQISEK